jgi:hypothetical protein
MSNDASRLGVTPSLPPPFRGRGSRPAFGLIGFGLLALVSLAPAQAEERQTSGDPRAGVWGLDPDSSSAVLARDGWKFLSMATLSWPDGRQAVVTMWNSELGDFARCFDYFDAKMEQTGGKCERSGTGL